MLLPDAWQNSIANALPNPRSTVKGGSGKLNEFKDRGEVATTHFTIKGKATLVLH